MNRSSRDRVILHVDMNAYFASVEQKSTPSLRGKPIVVVADSRRRSVILTASYEARAFGVKTGMNLYEAKKLSREIIAVDGNTDKYMDATAQILEVLESFTDVVEMNSCDEAFLDVTGSLKCFGTDGFGIAALVQQKVSRQIGLPCSVGVAPNKVLAKMASEVKKPNGITVVLPENVPAFLSEMPVEKVSGIGRKIKEKLNDLGIKTCAELGRSEIGFLEHHFGVWAYWLKKVGLGRDMDPVKKNSDADFEKSMGHSTTFPRDTTDPEILKSYLLRLSEKVAFRLRRRGLEGRIVSLVIRYKDFTTFSHEHRFFDPMNDGFEIFSAALKIMEKTVLEQSVRLIGVSVSGMVPTQWQEFLFEAMGRRRRVNGVTDEINKKFGRFTVKPASLLFAEKHGLLEPPIPPFISARRIFG